MFAAAIILFIMVAQHPPFGKAVANDAHYKLIVANRLDLFWKFHSRSKPNGLDFFSPEFMDLINSMLQHEPIHRPSLSEIKFHPWLQGKTATEQEIREEFFRRKQMLDQQSNQE